MSGRPTIIRLIARSVKGTISRFEQEELEKWKREVLFRWFRYISEAPDIALTLVVIFIVIFLKAGQSFAPVTAKHALQVDDHPYLVLPEGRMVWLDTLAVNEIIPADGFVLSKTREHEVSYVSLPASGDSHASLQTRYHTFYTPHGQSWLIVLPDGSKVQLNAGSELSYVVYPRAETSLRRTAILQEGEAFFEIAADQQRPFIVITETAVISVLGTRFDVRNKPQKDGFRVALTEGTIRLHYNDNRDSMTLHPGEGARIINNGCIVQQADTGSLCSWRSAQFDFTGKNMGQIFNEIEDWYGLDKSIFESGLDTVHPGELGGGHVSKDYSLKELLGKIQPAEISFTIVGKKVSINYSKK